MNNRIAPNFVVTSYRSSQESVKIAFEEFASDNTPSSGGRMAIVHLAVAGGSGIVLAYMQSGYIGCIVIDRKASQSYTGYFGSSTWNWRTISVS